MNPSSENCFLPLKQKAEGVIDFIEWLIDQELPWDEHFGFDAVPVDSCWIETEPALCKVNQLQPIKQLGLLRIPPQSMYDWHVDQYRLSCLNLLISQNHHSHTLFGIQRNYINKNICELQYEPKTYYLFNNQIEHCVINLDSPRYLLSLYFEEETAYDELKQRFLKENLC
jgi:hypothetical protein